MQFTLDDPTEDMGEFVDPLMPQQTPQQMPQQMPGQTNSPSVDGYELVDIPGSGSMTGMFKDTFKGLSDLANQKFIEPQDIDFSVDQGTGVDDFNFRWAVGMGDTSEEKSMIAKKYVGEDGLEFYDGKMALNSKGMERLGLEDKRPDNMKGVPVLVDELGLSMNDVADESDDMSQGALLAGNFLATRGAGPLAVFLRSLTSGASAYLGKQGQEKVEDKLGMNLQSQDEINSDALMDGVVNTVSELGFSGLDAGFRKMLGPQTTLGKKHIFGQPELQSTIEPERLAMMDRAREFNLDPSLTQATDGKLLSRPQQIAERVFNSNVKRNNKNVAGFKALAETETSKFGPETLELNEDQMKKVLAKDAESAIESAQRSVISAKNNVDQALKTSIDDIVNERGFVGDPGNSVKETLGFAMNKFREASKTLYAKVDQLAGNKQIVSTKNLRAKWDEIQALLPMGKDGKPIQTESVKELYALMNNMPTHRQTFAGMQDVRVILGQMNYSPELKGTNGERIAGLLKEALDQDFNNIVLGGGPKAVKAMREATDFYANNIGQFDNVLVAKLTRDMKVKGSVSPNQVVDTIIDSQSVDAIDNVRKLVGPDMWKEVQHEKIIRLAKDSIDVDTGQMYASQFEKSIRKLDPKGGDKVFNAFFGKDANQIRRLTKELSAVNGTIDPQGTLSKLVNGTPQQALGEATEKLDSGMVKDALKQALKQIDERNSLNQNEFLKALTEGGDLEPKFFDHLLTKDGALQMRDAIRLVGKDSERHKQMKKVGFRKLFDLVIKPNDDTLGETLGGKALYDKVREAKPALIELYGKKDYKRLEQLGALSAFLSSEKRFSGGLVAAAIAVRPLKNLGRIVKLSILEKLMSTDTFLNWATRGLMRNPALRTGSRATVRAVGQQGLNIIMDGISSLPSDFSTAMNSFSIPDDANDVDLSGLDEESVNNLGTRRN